MEEIGDGQRARIDCYVLITLYCSYCMVDSMAHDKKGGECHGHRGLILCDQDNSVHNNIAYPLDVV